MTLLKNALLIVLMLVLVRGSYELSYPSKTPLSLIYQNIQLESVIKHIHEITRYPHAVGQATHKVTRRYIERHIEQLNNPQITINQHNSSYYNPGNKRSAAVSNLMIQFPGTDPEAPALLLMAHYDSARFSGTGAADDAAGVGVVLEVFKTLIQQTPKPKNKLMVLITDGEELGLLGAHVFIEEQLRYHNIGAIINLEARGSSGPSIMLPETLKGNQGLIKAFKAANVPMPVSSSLDAEIYALMPNDTDVTPFKNIGIPAFNFAFIDDHFNYHTQADNLANISLNSVAHHLIQSKTLANYLSQADLTELNSEQSLVYFSLPELGVIDYSRQTSIILILVGWLAWLLLLILTLRHKALGFSAIIKSLKPLLFSVFFGFIGCYILLAAAYTFVPGWKDILQGFPYAGHHLINVQLIFTLVIVTLFYSRQLAVFSAAAAVLAIGAWLALVSIMVSYLPGAGFLIIPALLALPVAYIAVYKPHWAAQLAPFLLLPALLIMATLIMALPVAMGIWMAPAAMVVLVLLMAQFNAGFERTTKSDKLPWLLLIPVIYSGWIIFEYREFTPEQPLPTSVNYLVDMDSQQAYFYHADNRRGNWLRELFTQPLPEQEIEAFQKNYQKALTTVAKTDRKMPYPADITANKPLNQTPHQRINVTIQSQPGTDILSLYTKRDLTIHSLAVGNRITRFTDPLQLKAGYRILEHHITDNPTIELQLELDPGQTLDWQIQSHQSGLIEKFDLAERPINQMPKAFIASDLITTVQSWTFGDDQ